ncbi:sulfurtransferase complex subunit TusB [Colwellia sp. D2M02]|uniref:sulfurtransferase complex subunit TusB n=1 Tax=Colwellia sp. D2M02 TaxID=2841562 RepID=UPI001C08711A|nr:sulfurtransferase complex subunit TusB [Colwellia sp. D2M02]
MSILHLIRSSAFHRSDFEQCLSIAQSNDTIIFCDDGCYNLSHPLTTNLLAQENKLTIKVLQDHAQARAIIAPQTIEGITMEDLVSLTFTHDKVITWQ